MAAADRAAHPTFWTNADASFPRLSVISSFRYVSGEIHRMFAANPTKIFDVSTTTPVLVKAGQTSGNHAASQMANQAGDWLIVVNDAGDPPLRYDGTTWEVMKAAYVPPAGKPSKITVNLATYPGAWIDVEPNRNVALLAEITAAVLVFVYVSLEVRHLFDPGFERRGLGAEGLELYTYSIVWLLFGVALLALGFWRDVRGAAPRRHGAGLPGGRQGLPDRHGGPEGAAAGVLVPRPRCGAARPGLCLSALRIGTQISRSRPCFPSSICRSTPCAPCSSTRLKEALRHAYDHQAPYRAKCEAAGVHPDDLRTLDDLQRFPFTAKSDLRDAYPFGMLAIPREQCVRVHASSGTTGRPTVVGYSAQDIETWADLMARSLHAGGARPGDIIHNAYGYGLFTGGLGAHYGAERLGCTVVPMSGGFGERQVQLIREFGARVVLMTPSYMLAIADEFERQGVDPRDTAMRIGIFGAEPWTEGMRAEIERRLGIDAVDIYGLSEVMGPGVACEFVETKDGPTIWEDHFYPEIVDPETGAPVPDGEPGELVFTSLTKEAMPVIRYRTRDLTRLMPGSGTAMRRMAKITGRSDDMLIVRGVNLFPSQVEEQILRDPALSGHYVIELSRTGALDDLLVRVEARLEAVHEAAGRSAGALGERLKGMCGLSATIEVVAPGAHRALDGQGAPGDRPALARLIGGSAPGRADGQSYFALIRPESSAIWLTSVENVGGMML